MRHCFISKNWQGVVALACLFFIAGCDDNPIRLSSRPAPLLPSRIQADATLSPLDEPYMLDGYVVVEAPYTLTILPGTVIQGKPGTSAALIISRGAKIMAEGTAAAPIMFTSGKPRGKRAPGDWGGIIINGYATINNGDATGTRMGEGNTGAYGGSNDADNSGVLRYVRVEYAGYEYTEKSQLNGIAFQGVGSGTQVDHIQVHMCGDDGVEFFGGAVCVKYLLCSFIDDDAFDWTDGWRGKGQFWISCKPFQTSDKGIEGNTVGDDYDGKPPYSSPVIYNITLISQEEYSKPVGIHIREHTRLKLFNALVLNYKQGVKIDKTVWPGFIYPDSLTNGDTSKIGHSVFSNEDDFAPNDFNADMAGLLFGDTAFGNISDKTLRADALVNSSQWDYRASPKLTQVKISFSQPPSGGFFEQVDFVGAMGPDPEDDWAKNWICVDLN